MTETNDNLDISTKDFVEKRSFVRMHVNTSANLTLDATKEVIPATCTLLSTDSVEVESPHNFAGNESMEVKFTSRDLTYRAFVAKVKVIRPSQKNENNTYTTAAKIISIT